MELYADAINDLLTQLSWLMRTSVSTVVWAVGGQFMPSNCSWCRPAWLTGLGMGAVLIFVYFSGPRRD